MRAAGRDSTKLFGARFLVFEVDDRLITFSTLANMHSWVNVDFMLDACFVGFLVPEPSS